MLSLVLALLAVPQETPTVQVQMTRPGTYFEGSVLPIQGCADGSSEMAHLVIAGQTIEIPKASVEIFLPRELKFAGEPPNDFETAEFLLPANAGCAEASTELAVLSIASGTPSLPHGLMLGGPRFAPDEEVLRWRDEGRCHTDDDYVWCTGGLREEQRFPTMVLISRTATSRDGGPLFVVCEMEEGFEFENPASPYVPWEHLVCVIYGNRGEMPYSARLGVKPLVNEMRAGDDAIQGILDRVLRP
jgi:hypothetical protein